MSQLGGIWASPQAVDISFTTNGSRVDVTIAAPCVAACTVPNEDLILIGGVPAPYRPSVARMGPLAGLKQDAAFSNGAFYTTPQGFLGFSAPYGWELDAATQSGVSAQVLSYDL